MMEWVISVDFHPMKKKLKRVWICGKVFVYLYQINLKSPPKIGFLDIYIRCRKDTKIKPIKQLKL
jgi:hypothetical protein